MRFSRLRAVLRAAALALIVASCGDSAPLANLPDAIESAVEAAQP